MIAILLAPLVVEATARGVRQDAILGALGIASHEIRDKQKRISAARVFAAWELAVKRIDDPALPIAIGKSAVVDGFGVLGYALYTAPTSQHSLEVLARYHDLINDTGRWSLVVTPQRCCVGWERSGGRTLGMRLANEQVLASFIALADRITPDPIAVQEVRINHSPPRDTSAHEAHFRAPIHWNAGEDAILLDPGFLTTTPRGFDPVTTAFFEGVLEQEMSKLGPAGSWKHRVATVVGARLSGGLPTLAQVAKELDSSPRTLRRRLSEEGARFDALVVELQRSRADAMIDRGALMRDVAFAVGYADESSFSRAYKRWTGAAPSTRAR